MHHSIFRALILGSIIAALALAAPGRPAQAEDEPAAGDGAGPEPAGITWVNGWEAGREQAKKDGRLIFLYFGRKSPT
ncbi:MAG: hypothetical protein QNJ90_08860 [Planctomycetota bacterium]|nr:hypothetical protein [Planctomycetota bacterium]